MNVLTLLSSSACLGLVAWVSWRLTRGHTDSSQGFFLAGRSLTAPLIAGSLLMTNLSTEQMVGLAGSAYAFNMSSMAWEVTAGLACIVMALVLLPRYLASGYTTLPQFLESHFDGRVRRASAALFVLGYSLITLPAVLYSGSMAVLALGDLPQTTGLNHDDALLLTLVTVACIGGAFAIAGGLRSIAISDTLFGAGLLMMGFLVAILGLLRLGNGSVLNGLHTLRMVHPEKLNAIGAATDPTPIATVFTGMLLANLFYWGTNQYVIQRVLGARSLAEGQKGVLLSGFFKLFVPLLIMVPGVIAFHLYGNQLPSMDAAYPTLARDVLPPALHGVFLAIVLGLVVSSFNSLVNSAATLISIDLLPASAGHAVTIARLQSVILVGLSLLFALQLAEATEGLWQLIRRFTGFYNIPVITLVLIALVRQNLNPDAAIAIIVLHVLIYGWCTFVHDPGIHFVHLYALLFIAEAALLLVWPGTKRVVRTDTAPAPVDMTPWRGRHLAAGLLLLCIVVLYVLFSPVGTSAGIAA